VIIDRLVAKLDGLRFDQIVGIPRGGLIVAAALAYRLEVRDVGAFSVRYQRHVDGAVTVGRLTCRPIVRAHSRLLLVEDGTATGTLIDFARRYLERRRADVTTAALWVSKAHDYRPDVWVEEVDTLPSGASLLAVDRG
jgi:hypoxanthine phosphoribosyltransferase